MFEYVKTFCKMLDEAAAIKHAAQLSLNPVITKTGTQFTENKGWRSWFITEHLVHDVILKDKKDDN